MVTSAERTQAVEPLGRVARRTSSHAGCWAITGKAEAPPYQLEGIVLSCGPPGLAYPLTAPLVVAIKPQPPRAAELPGIAQVGSLPLWLATLPCALPARPPLVLGAPLLPLSPPPVASTMNTARPTTHPRTTAAITQRRRTACFH